MIDDMTVFREYELHEPQGANGYPLAWHDLRRGEPLIWTTDGRGIECWDEEAVEPYGVKHLVRDIAGRRCQRCGHPYICGGTYSEAATDDQAFDLYPQGGGSGATRLWSVDEPPGAMVGKQRPVNWSPCDDHCTHGGPLRCLVDGQVAWMDDGSNATKTPCEYGAGDRRTTIQAAWRILTVHHLNERKHDLRWWNLAALCQRCHLVIQRKVTMEQPWPWEHSAWFRPHAAAWYALRYLGEHLTYTQTVARLDELLALGQHEESVERMAL